MANKRKKKRAKGRRGRKGQLQNLPVLGEKQLEKHQFAEAIKTFRQLLKNDDDKGWFSLLARAYRGRIDQLTAKGMAKEALVIYGNMVNSCSMDDQRLYMNLLLNCGNYEQAFEIYLVLAKSLDKNECQAVEEIFAALLLSGTEQRIVLSAR